MRDESTITIDGNISGHTLVSWSKTGERPPKVVHKEADRSKKKNLRIAILYEQMIGPFFFAGTVNGDVYRK